MYQRAEAKLQHKWFNPLTSFVDCEKSEQDGEDMEEIRHCKTSPRNPSWLALELTPYIPYITVKRVATETGQSQGSRWMRWCAFVRGNTWVEFIEFTLVRLTSPTSHKNVTAAATLISHVRAWDMFLNATFLHLVTSQGEGHCK